MRAAALAQRKRDHQRGARQRSDPEQRPRPLMGDGDGHQRGRDRQDAEHHAAMRGVDRLHAHRHQQRKQDADAEHGDRRAAATARAAAAAGAARAAAPASTARQSPCASRSAPPDRSRKPQAASPAACRRRSPCRQSPATGRGARARNGRHDCVVTTWRTWLPILPIGVQQSHSVHMAAMRALTRCNAAPHQSERRTETAGRARRRRNCGRSARDRSARRAMRRSACRASAISASQNTSGLTKPVAICTHKRGAKHGAIEDLEDAAALLLGPAAHARPQDRQRPGQSGKPAQNAAGKSDGGVRRLAAEDEGHRRALEIERGREDQQQHADAQLEHLADRRARSAACRAACRSGRRSRTARPA